MIALLVPKRSAPLSERQEQCLLGVLQLKSAKQIGRDLGISSHAVEKHLLYARRKFGVTSTNEAARLYASEGRAAPDYGFPDDGKLPVANEGSGIPESILGDSTGDLLQADRLPATHTLFAILAVSVLSIVGLLLLIACAEGIAALVK